LIAPLLLFKLALLALPDLLGRFLRLFFALLLVVFVISECQLLHHARDGIFSRDDVWRWLATKNFDWLFERRGEGKVVIDGDKDWWFLGSIAMPFVSEDVFE